MKEMKRKISLLLALILVITMLPNVTAKAVTNEKKAIKVLFIGNSKTYYNNVPRMFRNIASHDADCKYDVTVKSLTWGKHRLAAWALDIDEVRTIHKGVKVEKQERRLDNNQREQIEKVLFNSKGSAIVYDYVVLQGQTNEILDENDYKDGVLKVCKALSNNKNITKDTTIVINSVWSTFDSSQKDVVANQNKIDSTTADIVGNKTFTGNYKAIPAYTGKAALKFLKDTSSNKSNYIKSLKYYKATTNGTQKKSFTLDKGTPYNDLIVSDTRHPNQLGSLLEAAVIYIAICNDNPATNNTYKGSVTEVTIDLSECKPGTCLKNITLDSDVLKVIYNTAWSVSNTSKK